MIMLTPNGVQTELFFSVSERIIEKIVQKTNFFTILQCEIDINLPGLSTTASLRNFI